MSKSKRAWLWLRYIAINSVFAVSIYFGFFAEDFGGTNLTGAENLALLLGWVTGILGALILIALAIADADDISKKGEYRAVIARSDPSVVPFPVDLTFDMCIILAFAWTGHYVLAFFYILSVYAGKAIRDVPKNIV